MHRNRKLGKGGGTKKVAIASIEKVGTLDAGGGVAHWIFTCLPDSSDRA